MKSNKEPKGKLHVMTAGTDEDGVTYVFKEARFDSFEDMKKIIALQAAAPELLEACQEILASINRAQNVRLDTSQLEAAIQKATQCTK